MAASVQLLRGFGKKSGSDRSGQTGETETRMQTSSSSHVPRSDCWMAGRLAVTNGCNTAALRCSVCVGVKVAGRERESGSRGGLSEEEEEEDLCSDIDTRSVCLRVSSF